MLKKTNLISFINALDTFIYYTHDYNIVKFLVDSGYKYIFILLIFQMPGTTAGMLTTSWTVSMESLEPLTV